MMDGMHPGEVPLDLKAPATDAGQPPDAPRVMPELAAAMAETRTVRRVLARMFSLFTSPDGRGIQHADVTRKTLERYAAEAGMPQDAGPCGYTEREKAILRELGECEAVLAEALGYPWSDEISGYVIGDHTPVSLAMEARTRLGIVTREYHEAREQQRRDRDS